ncbi:fumarylacetoacetate hydrolase family protein [Streptomyces europaeiscabiei]|nr:fumarylacetoacetate hydrolase family protein [Streptomyces europaeiscabiei]MDX3713208.1 fumarylacetoacetate hydrolase family protein [Streptomyces europaeiscabiei]
MTRLVSTVKGIGRLEDDGETIASLDVDTTEVGTALQGGLDLGALAMAAVRDRVPTTRIQLLAPVPRPSKIWVVGYAYAGHRTEVDYDGVAEEPVVFLKAPSSVIGAGEQIRFPKAAPDEATTKASSRSSSAAARSMCPRRRRTRSSPASRSSTTSAPVTCRRAVSPAGRPMFTAAKSFDTFTPMGPALVTLDEFTDPDDLRLRTWVDDALRQDAGTSQLIHALVHTCA